MILADTTIWVDHFRAADPHLADLLNQDEILVHPWTIGEIACGSFANRVRAIEFLQNQPQASPASHEEVLLFLNAHSAFGRGIGYVDAHLLTAALAIRCKLWTRDKRMGEIAQQLNLSY
jgi:predicted nucleic acid-binding protein